MCSCECEAKGESQVAHEAVDVSTGLEASRKVLRVSCVHSRCISEVVVGKQCTELFSGCEVELIRLLWTGRSGYRADLSQWENPRILSPPHRHATVLICSPSRPTRACPSPSPTLASPQWPEPRQRQPAEPNNSAGPLCWRRSARDTSKQVRAEYQNLMQNW